LLSPFPVVDAVFEAANKAVAGFLTAIYLWSPGAALVLNLLIFGVCLLIFSWVHRRAIYMRSVLGDPVLGWLAEKIFRRPAMTIVTTRLPAAIAGRFPQRTLVLKAFAGQSIKGVRRKARGFLVQSEGRLHFVRPRLLRVAMVVPLPEGRRAELNKGLLSNTVVMRDDAGGEAVEMMITRRYNGTLDAVRLALAAGQSAQPAVEAGASESALQASRSIGVAAKESAGREVLRAEFA
jgi:hypothetical protein